MFEKKVSDAEKKRLLKEAKKKEKAMRKSDSNSLGTKVVNILKTLVVPALLAGIACLVIYMAMENKAAEAQLKGQVLVLKDNVAANTFVKSDDISEYFTEVSVELTAIPETAYRSLSELPSGGFYIEETLSKSQMLLKDDIATSDSILDKYKAGFEVTSISAESFDGGVNGSLRKGDIVDIYAKDPATEELVLLAENVYVSEVYDNAGNKIATDEGIATSFTVYVTPDEVVSVNRAIMYGNVQMYLKTE